MSPPLQHQPFPQSLTHLPDNDYLNPLVLKALVVGALGGAVASGPIAAVVGGSLCSSSTGGALFGAAAKSAGLKLLGFGVSMSAGFVMMVGGGAVVTAAVAKKISESTSFLTSGNGEWTIAKGPFKMTETEGKVAHGQWEFTLINGEKVTKKYVDGIIETYHLMYVN